MNNMLRAILKELVNVEDGVLGIILDFLKKLNADKTGEFLTQFKKFLRGEMVEKVISYITDTFIVMVDETLSVEEAAKVGKFHLKNDSIITSEEFPKLAKGKKLDREIVLFHFTQEMVPKEIITEMNRAGYRPANIWELIALAVREPKLQIGLKVFALNSAGLLGGHFRVPCLCLYDSGRSLCLSYFNPGWDGCYRFAAIHK